MSLKLLLVVGPYCPIGRVNYRKRLLCRLINSGHQVVLLIAAVNDPLSETATQYQVPVHYFLPELNQSQRFTQISLSNSDAQAQLSAWLDVVRRAAPDLGICFYGNWLPPSLFQLPKHGFLNFHPGPLPELCGMEPDTFAILDGRQTTHGTVHVLTEQFDRGALVAVTPELTLKPDMLPIDVDRALAQMSIPTVLKAIAAIATGTVIYRQQDSTRTTCATRQRARSLSYLNFHTDDSAVIDRKRRAFLSQNIGIRLKAQIQNRCYEVRDLETWAGDFSGTAGDFLGFYQGEGYFSGGIIIRSRDGVTVLRLGHCFAAGETDAAARAPLPDPAVRFDSGRPRLTTLLLLRRSIAFYLGCSLI
jgi:methionyl-tRNA formyltransferase